MSAVPQVIQVAFRAPGNQGSGRAAGQRAAGEGGFPGSCGEDVRTCGRADGRRAALKSPAHGVDGTDVDPMSLAQSWDLLHLGRTSARISPASQLAQASCGRLRPHATRSTSLTSAPTVVLIRRLKGRQRNGDRASPKGRRRGPGPGSGQGEGCRGPVGLGGPGQVGGVVWSRAQHRAWWGGGCAHARRDGGSGWRRGRKDPRQQPAGQGLVTGAGRGPGQWPHRST